MRNKLLKEPRIDGEHLKGWMQLWKTTKTSFAVKTTGWVGSYLSVISARVGKVDEITAEFEHKRKQVGTWTLEHRKPCFTRICLACPTSHLLASRTRAALCLPAITPTVSHRAPCKASLALPHPVPCFIPSAPTPWLPHLPRYLTGLYWMAKRQDVQKSAGLWTPWLPVLAAQVAAGNQN